MTEKQKIDRQYSQISREFRKRSLVYHKAKRALALRFYELTPSYVKVAGVFNCHPCYARQMVNKARREQINE